MDLRYWYRAVQSLGSHAKHDPRFLLGLLSAGLAADSRGRARTVFIHAAYPQMKELDVEMGAIRYRSSDQDPLERFFLGGLCQIKRPKAILEIGTFDGATTRLLARNAPDARVFTLDLPSKDAALATFQPEADHVIAGGVGSAFANTPEASRIEQLFCDSRSFDSSPWRRKIDLVVIDGGHEYDCVSADTRSAQVALKPGGVIVWDDYDPIWPSVIRAVDETGLPVIHIANTGLAVYDSSTT
jgi:spermidine synthase